MTTNTMTANTISAIISIITANTISITTTNMTANAAINYYYC